MSAGKVCYDHLGNKFKSERALCAFYNLNIHTYITRKNNNWSLKDILTTPPSRNNRLKEGKAPRTDHLGKTYPTFIAMCKAYGLTDFNVQNRLNLGWSLEKALTTPTKKRKEVTDHLGNKFETQKDLCKHYGISITILKDRLGKGMSLKDALITHKQNGIKIDHLGNIYESQIKMCKHYNINAASFKERLEKGYSLEEALTTPKKYIRTNSISGTYIETFNGNHYYKCQCKKCNWKHKKILTIQEIFQHKKECV